MADKEIEINFTNIFLRLPMDMFVKWAVNQNDDLYPFEVVKHLKDKYDVKKDPKTKQDFINIEARLVSKIEGQLLDDKRKDLT